MRFAAVLLLAGALLSCASLPRDSRGEDSDAAPSDQGPAPLDKERAELFGRYGGEFVDAGGIRTHYFEFGDRGAEETVIFLHGYAGGGLEAGCIAPQLVASGFRLVAPDWPGAGLSDLLPEYSMDALTAWLDAFRIALGIERFHLVGHSLGGFLSIRYAARYPDRVEGLVLIAPAGFEKEIGAFLAALADSPSIVGAAAALYIPWYYNVLSSLREFEHFSRAPKEILEYSALTIATDTGRRGMKELALRILGGEPDLDCLGSIEAPVLLLWAEEDRILPYRWRERFLEGLPPSTVFVSLSDCGHAPHLEKPGETAAVLLQFLRSAARGE